MVSKYQLSGLRYLSTSSLSSTGRLRYMRAPWSCCGTGSRLCSGESYVDATKCKDQRPGRNDRGWVQEQVSYQVSGIVKPVWATLVVQVQSKSG